MNLQARITAQAPALLVLMLSSLLLVPPAHGEDCGALQTGLASRTAADPRHPRSGPEPWLRRDAFLAAELRAAVEAGDGASARPILEAMAELDARTLPSGTALAARARACRTEAVAALLAAPTRLAAVAREPLPDVYRGWQRLLGAYALARPFLRAGAARWRAREQAAIADGVAPVRLVHAARAAVDLEPAQIAELLRSARGRHPLAWPAPDAATLDRLGRALAPEFATSATPTHARIGALTGGGGRPVVDPARPRVYLDHGFVRWGRHVLLQLAWTVWFTERPPAHPLDPYAGQVDGLVLRVTLGDDGRALVWESIHLCGCYYTVALPNDRSQRYLHPDPAVLEAPLMLAGPAAADRVRAHYTPAEHYLRTLTRSAAAPAAEHLYYELEPWDALLVERPDRPPFAADGLLRGTGRGERVFLWPSGIPSPGAMRTPGRHATAFLGRRRFETAELLDGRLRTNAPE